MGSIPVGQTNFYLKRFRNKSEIGFLPFFSVTKAYGVGCYNCGAVQTMQRNEYQALKKTQKEKLMNMEFPSDVVLLKYQPMFLHFKRSLIFLIICSVWACIAFLLMISMMKEKPSGALGEILFFIIMAGPGLAISIPKFIEELNYKKIYEKYVQQQRRQ